MLAQSRRDFSELVIHRGQLHAPPLGRRLRLHPGVNVVALAHDGRDGNRQHIAVMSQQNFGFGRLAGRKAPESSSMRIVAAKYFKCR